MKLDFIVELELSPICENKAKEFLNDLFAEHDVNVELPRASINFVKNKEERIDKIRVHFNNQEMSLEFAEYCKYLPSLSNTNKTCVLLSVNCVNDDQNNSFEVYDDNLDDSISTIVRLEKPPHVPKEVKNEVLFKIEPRLDESSLDLELILLFLSNEKRSSGGDILEFKYDSESFTLKVIFEHKSSVERLLKKHTLHAPHNYTLKIPQEDTFEVERNILVMKNIKSNIDNEVLQIYIENLVQNNEIIEIIRSRVFKNTIFVKFDKEIDLSHVLARHKMRPNLQGNQVTIHRAYNTPSIFGILSNGSTQPREIFDLHFTNTKRSSSDSYEKLEQFGSLFVLEFKDKMKRDQVLNKKEQKIGKAELILEPLYTREILNDLLMPHTPSSNELNDIEIIPEYRYDMSQDTVASKIKFMSLKCKEIRKDFEAYLKNKHFKLQNEIIFVNEETNEYPNNFEIFKTQVQTCLNEFADRIQHDDYHLSEKITQEKQYEVIRVINEINEQHVYNFLELTENCIKIHGYIHGFPPIIKQLNKDLGTLKYTIQKKDESIAFSLDVDTKNLLDESTNHFTMLLQELVTKYNALIEGTSNGLLVSCCDAKKIPDSVTWRAQVENHIRAFVEKLNASSNDLTKLKRHEARLLFLLKYKSEMERTFPGLKIRIDMQLLKIVYECDDFSKIEQAKSKALDIFSKIKSKSFRCEPFKLEFLKENETELVKWINQTNCMCVIDLESESKQMSFTIYGLDHNRIQKCYDSLSEYVVIEELSVVKTTEINKINQFISKHHSKLIWERGKVEKNFFKIKMNHDQTMLSITGFKNHVKEVINQLSEFIT